MAGVSLLAASGVVLPAAANYPMLMLAVALAFGMLLDAGGRDGVLPGVALQLLQLLAVLAMGRGVGSGALKTG